MLELALKNLYFCKVLLIFYEESNRQRLDKMMIEKMASRFGSMFGFSTMWKKVTQPMKSCLRRLYGGLH